MKLNFSQAINAAIHSAMSKNKKSVYFGLGTGDPKEIFGTTSKLIQKFGSARVYDVPTSENALTGIAIGLATQGYTVIFSHQRFDFLFLSLDQIINNAAKWFFMYGGKTNLPLVIRVIVGNGWGQGPTHSQSYHSILGLIPGIKVVFPSGPNEAYNLLSASIKYKNPVVFVENRQLYKVEEEIKSEKIQLKNVQPKIIKSQNNSNLILIGVGYVIQNLIEIQRQLVKFNIFCEVWDMRIIDLNLNKRNKSRLKKIFNLFIFDPGHYKQSWGHLLVSELKRNSDLMTCILAHPDYPETTSQSGLNNYHLSPQRILKEFLGRKIINQIIFDKITKNMENSEKSATGMNTPF